MKLSATFVLVLLAHLAFGQDRIQRLNNLLDSLYSEGSINGCFLIAEKGEIIYNRSFGLANEDTKEKITENTVFELASVSKQFTAMAIMMLSEDGKLKLDDKIKVHIPELAFYKGVTIRNLMHHTGGIPAYEQLMEEFFDKTKIATNDDIIQLLSEKKPKPLFKPNTKFQYSNTGYALLASIVERASGVTYGEFLNQRIFTPLGMTSTLVYNRRYAPRNVDQYALGYVYSESLQKYVLPDEVEESKMVIWMDGIVGDGCVNSSALDLLKWDRALYTNQLLSAEGMRQLFITGVLRDKTKLNYGCGWFVGELKDLGKFVNHSGGWPGYRTYIERQLDNDKTIIVLQNHDNIKLPLDAIHFILYNKMLPEEKLSLEVKIPDEIAQKYVGIYVVEENYFVTIMMKEDGYYLFADNSLSKIHFTSETDFFNTEFPTEKHFVSDESGQITGYQRTLLGTQLPWAKKIVDPLKFKGEEDYFNTIGWGFLVNNHYTEAISFLKRGLEVYPNSLFLAGNLAHSYLFNSDYESAIAIYKAHLNESVNPSFSWKDMIQQDFMLFKNDGLDKGLMDKVLADLKLEGAEGY